MINRSTPNASNDLRRISLFLVVLSLALMAGGVFLGAETSNHFGTRLVVHQRSSSVLAQSVASAEVRQFQIITNDIVYDRIGQMLYASVPSRFGGTGNSVVQIDLRTLTVGPPIWVGSEPGRMTVSDDGTALYVALDGAKAVRRIDLKRQVAGMQFWMGNATTTSGPWPVIDGPYFAADLAAVPGQSNSVAILSNGPTIYRDGLKLPHDTGVANYYSVIRLVFSDSASILYGVSYDGDFLKYAVDDNGVSLVRQTRYFDLLGNGRWDLRFAGRLIYGGLSYGSTGKVIDPEIPSVVNTFSLPSPNQIFAVEPDPQTGRLYVLGGKLAPDGSGNYVVTIYAFDINSLALVDSVVIPGVLGELYSFTRWGANGFAFRTSRNQLFVVRTSLVPSNQPIDLPSATQPAPVNPTTLPSTIREIALPNDDLIYDKLRGLIYASVPEFAGANGNSITPINPTTGQIGSGVHIGINPGKMALSRDSQYLYTALISEQNVRRLNLQTQTIDAEFNIQYTPGQFTYVSDMEVMPEDPGTVVVARTSNIFLGSQALGIGVYKNGTFHVPTTIVGQSVLEASDEPSVFYGSDICCAANYAKFKIDFLSTGTYSPLSPIYVADNLIGGRSADFKWSGGLLFDSGGHIVEPQGITPLGQFDLSAVLSRPLVAADMAVGHAYFLDGLDSIAGSTFTLRVFDTHTFLPIGSIRIPGVKGDAGPLIRWGSDGLAFGTGGNQIFLIQSPLFRPTNRIDDASTFVVQHYLDFLNRGPDAAGFDFWTHQITDCGTDLGCIEVKRIQVSAAFFLSIEFQETGFLVYRMYKSAYGNLANTPVPVKYEELLPDTLQIGLGVVVGQGNWQALLESNKVAFAHDFVTRSRFTSMFDTMMTPAQFVDALYQNADVTPSASERATVIGEFGGSVNTADTEARARAFRRVAESPTLTEQEFNRAFVLMQYFGYLRRNPYDPPEATLDYSGYNFWLNKLNQFKGDFAEAEMVKAFIVSGEYRQRFGP